MQRARLEGSSHRQGKKKVASFELTGQHDFQSVCKSVDAEEDNIGFANRARSCGTAFKVREKRTPGVVNPLRSLRSKSYPDGLPVLFEIEENRDQESNFCICSNGRADFTPHRPWNCSFS